MTPSLLVLILAPLALVGLLVFAAFVLRARQQRKRAEEATLDGLAREAALRIATAEQRQARRDRRRPGRQLH